MEERITLTLGIETARLLMRESASRAADEEIFERLLGAIAEGLAERESEDWLNERRRALETLHGRRLREMVRDLKLRVIDEETRRVCPSVEYEERMARGG